LRRILLAIALIATAALVITSSSLAATTATTISVTTTSDAGTGTGDCLHTDASCSLRQAVSAADTLSDDAATVILPAGTYTLTDGPLEVDPGSGSTVAIAGMTAADTVISAGGASQVIAFASGTASATDVTFEDGDAASADGGCIDVGAAATVSLKSTTVQDCTSGMDGGGISVEGSLSTMYTLIEDDSAADLGGGVAVLTASNITATVLLFGSPITDDTAALGGAVGVDPNPAATKSLVELTSTTVAGSTASESGGGVYATASGNTTSEFDVVLVDSTVSGNAASGAGATGGGVAAAGDSVYVMTDATIADNQATTSGGDVSTSSASFVGTSNTIFAEGTAGNGQGDCSGGSLVSYGYNLDDQNNCGLDGPGDQINTDPDLGPLQDNGGAEDDEGIGALPTMALDVGSPAIGAGNPESMGVGACSSFDERATDRPAGACDIGAYQSEPPTYSSVAAGSVTQSGATVAADVANPDWVPVTLSVEYGTTSGSYPDSSAASEDVNEAGSAFQVATGGAAPSTPYSFALTGLQPNTTYYYRIVGTNSRGAVVSSEESFTTSAASMPTTSTPTPTTSTSTTPTSSTPTSSTPTSTTVTSTTPSPVSVPSNRFSVTTLKVSSKGVLSARLTAPDAGVFSLKATFKVKESVFVKKGHKRVQETKTVTETYASGTVRTSRATTPTFTLKISKAAAKELLKLKQVKVTVTITFTPKGGKPAAKAPTVTVKQSKAGRYS
jgi:hypothetical protein